MVVPELHLFQVEREVPLRDAMELDQVENRRRSK